MGKDFEKQRKTIKDQGKKQVDTLKFLESFDKQLPSIKDFVSKERLNTEIINELEKIEKEEKKLIEVKCITKDIVKHMILENLKQYVLLVMLLEIILLMCIQQIMNKTIWQSILKNLKARQDHNMILT